MTADSKQYWQAINIAFKTISRCNDVAALWFGARLPAIFFFKGSLVLSYSAH